MAPGDALKWCTWSGVSENKQDDLCASLGLRGTRNTHSDTGSRNKYWKAAFATALLAALVESFEKPPRTSRGTEASSAIYVLYMLFTHNYTQ